MGFIMKQMLHALETIFLNSELPNLDPPLPQVPCKLKILQSSIAFQTLTANHTRTNENVSQAVHLIMVAALESLLL
jgi:hypothetical protein